MSVTAKSIDEVIKSLDDIIQTSINDSSALGYFPALYQKVTVSVKNAIEDKEFQNNALMEQLDVIFANRYIKAYNQWKTGKQLSSSWAESFQVAGHFWPIVLQHLLLGMNAHISLDLGIAAAQVSEGKNILDFKSDFDKINEILKALVGEVQNDLSIIWPMLTKILKWTGKLDDFVVNFGMEKARDSAWEYAVELSKLSGKELDDAIMSKDKVVAKLSQKVADPGLVISIALKAIRIGELGSIKNKINALTN